MCEGEGQAGVGALGLGAGRAVPSRSDVGAVVFRAMAGAAARGRGNAWLGQRLAEAGVAEAVRWSAVRPGAGARA